MKTRQPHPPRRFARYIGIDYSGAEAPVSRLRALQVYETDGSMEAMAVAPFDSGARNWCRKEIARYVHERLRGDEPCIIAIDHGFSMPIDYMRRNGIENWEDFLRHFAWHWPTARDHMYVDFVRDQDPPLGNASELRLCERWTHGARSVFQFDVHGAVAKATHAGIPWIKQWRDDRRVRARTHFWPFDGFTVEPGRSVVAEIFPSMLRRRYVNHERTVDQHDAYASAMWLRDMDVRGALVDYFNPPLTLPERRQAQLEGWILGVR